MKELEGKQETMLTLDIIDQIVARNDCRNPSKYSFAITKIYQQNSMVYPTSPILPDRN